MAGPRLRYRSNHVLTLLLAAIVVAAIVSHAPPALAANVRMTLRGEQPRTEPWNIRHHLGTKSPYWPQNPARTPVPSGCQLANVNLVARHGSREPTQKDIDRLSRLADKFHTYAQYITDPQLAWLKSWQNPVDPRNAGLLALTGQNEHYALAKRMMAEYAPLLSQQYYPYTYIFQSTQGIAARSERTLSRSLSLSNQPNTTCLPACLFVGCTHSVACWCQCQLVRVRHAPEPRHARRRVPAAVHLHREPRPRHRAALL